MFAFAGHADAKGDPTQKTVHAYVLQRTGKAEKANYYAPLIVKKARKHKIEPMLLARLIAVESNFNPRLVSPAGARGLMQVMPFHFKSHGYKLSQWKNPDVNLELGCRLYVGYRTRMQKLYPRASATSIQHRTLVAYNMGPRAVSRGITRSRYSRIIVTGRVPR